MEICPKTEMDREHQSTVEDLKKNLEIAIFNAMWDSGIEDRSDLVDVLRKIYLRQRSIVRQNRKKGWSTILPEYQK